MRKREKHLKVVDSHMHTSDVWWEPIEAHLFQMDRNGVDQAVLIQFWGQDDNSYHAHVQRRFPGRFANVVYVDPSRPDAIDDLARLAEQGASGVRLRPQTRSPGDDPLAIWRAAARLDLTVSCGGAFFRDEADDDFTRVIEAVPQTRIVIEHLGAASRPDKTDAERALRRRAIALARFANVFMRIPGLGEFATRALPPRPGKPFVEPIPDLLQVVYDAFGPDRMMWGSDFPNTSQREGYANALNLCRAQFASRPQADVDLIFGGVAARLFPVR